MSRLENVGDANKHHDVRDTQGDHVMNQVNTSRNESANKDHTQALAKAQDTGSKHLPAFTLSNDGATSMGGAAGDNPQPVGATKPNDGVASKGTIESQSKPNDGAPSKGILENPSPAGDTKPKDGTTTAENPHPTGADTPPTMNSDGSPSVKGENPHPTGADTPSSPSKDDGNAKPMIQNQGRIPVQDGGKDSLPSLPPVSQGGSDTIPNKSTQDAAQAFNGRQNFPSPSPKPAHVFPKVSFPKGFDLNSGPLNIPEVGKF